MTFDQMFNEWMNSELPYENDGRFDEITLFARNASRGNLRRFALWLDSKSPTGLLSAAERAVIDAAQLWRGCGRTSALAAAVDALNALQVPKSPDLIIAEKLGRCTVPSDALNALAPEPK